jgi:hypothetical protein
LAVEPGARVLLGPWAEGHGPSAGLSLEWQGDPNSVVVFRAMASRHALETPGVLTGLSRHYSGHVGGRKVGVVEQGRHALEGWIGATIGVQVAWTHAQVADVHAAGLATQWGTPAVVLTPGIGGRWWPHPRIGVGLSVDAGLTGALISTARGPGVSGGVALTPGVHVALGL